MSYELYRAAGSPRPCTLKKITQYVHKNVIDELSFVLFFVLFLFFLFFFFVYLHREIIYEICIEIL